MQYLIHIYTQNTTQPRFPLTHVHDSKTYTFFHAHNFIRTYTCSTHNEGKCKWDVDHIIEKLRTYTNMQNYALLHIHKKNSLSHKTLYTQHTKGHSAVIEMLLQCVRGIGSL